MNKYIIASAISLISFLIIRIYFFIVKNRSYDKNKTENKGFNTTEKRLIMGKSKFVLSQLKPNEKTTISPSEKEENLQKITNIFVQSTDESPIKQIPDEELKQVFAVNGNENFDEEEDGYFYDDEDEVIGGSHSNIPVASGATFEEINTTIQTVMNINNHSEEEQMKAGGILVRLSNTDLFNQLVSSKAESVSILMDFYTSNLINEETVSAADVPTDFDVNSII